MCTNNLCGGFPVIHFGWNPKPQVPTRWVISVALIQLSFWILLTIADELAAADPLGFIDDQELTTLQWIDACLGLICVATLILVGHLLKTHSDFSWRALLASSLVSTIIFAYVLHAALNESSVSRKMLQSYQEVLRTGTSNYTIAMTSFPPIKVVLLQMTKTIAATLGFSASFSLMIIMLKLLFKVEIRDRKNKLEIDMEDEDRSAEEKEHREIAVVGMAALAAAVSSFGICNLITFSYADSVAISSPVTYFEKHKILLPLGCILVSSILWMFHRKRTETRESAVFLSAILLALITILHSVALRLCEVEMRKLDIYDDKKYHRNGTFCVNLCPIQVFSLPQAGNCSEEVCIESKKYCDGVVDMTTQNEFNATSDQTVFFSSSKHYTNATVLLYPDELYCSGRLKIAYIFSYLLTFISFCFAVALIVRTRPIIHFLIRRRAKEMKKKRAENIPYGNLEN